MFEKLKSIFFKNKLQSKFVVKEQEEVFSINYKNHEVFYSKGTSLINRIIDNGDYEQDVVEVILKELSVIKAPCVIDIGANIGLISISILDKIPSAKIYAFEPGPHQFKLFNKTIAANDLSSRVTLSPIAMSNNKGKAIFQIHSSEDASGDGFFDTERAGATKAIEVETDTLDNWWQANGSPKIDFVKMDTEGAEYWILQGGKKMIENCKPTMVIEIFEQNIKNYPFKLYDVIEFIWMMKYEIRTVEREIVTQENWSSIMKRENTFLLLPLL